MPSGRQRDLFPLPRPDQQRQVRSEANSFACTRSVARRGLRRGHADAMVSEVVNTLNELYVGQPCRHGDHSQP
eukprot:5756038-Pyramimonas_sp.AAC.1